MKKLLMLLALVSFSAAAQTALKVGTKAIHVGTLGAVEVKIISIREDGNYVAKYQDTIYRNVSRDELAVMKGCLNELCVNDKAIHVGTLGGVKVQIIAIRTDGNYVAKYEDTKYRNVTKNELASLEGCSEDICVGDKATHLGTLGAVEVKIIAIRADGNYVAKYDDTIYRNVDRSELGKM